MAIRFSLIAFFIVFFGAGSLAAEKFQFRYAQGMVYKFKSEVKQTVYVNNRFDHIGNQIDRATISIDSMHDQWAHHVVDYVNSRESDGTTQAYQYDRTYHGEFNRNNFGAYDIPPGLFIPTVRNVPVFPDRDVQIGESWAYDGTEVQDFRDGLGIPDPFEYPFTASYTYLGREDMDGKNFDKIKINYTLYYDSPKRYPKINYPVQVTGYSHQTLYWDYVNGHEYAYQEEYLINLTFLDGTVMTFKGTASAKVSDLTGLPPSTVDDIKAKVKELDIPNISVRKTDDGVTIAMENIQFGGDSSVLLPSEKAKLDRLIQILAQYSDRDLLISGYTALAGTEQSRQQLSEQRAQSVGQYLLDKGARTRAQIMTRGLGATNPIADNATEDGKARNRRVEITILDK